MSDWFKLTGLWERASSRGGDRILVGRLAGARMIIVPNRDAGEPGEPDFLVLIAEAEDRRSSQGGGDGGRTDDRGGRSSDSAQGSATVGSMPTTSANQQPTRRRQSRNAYAGRRAPAPAAEATTDTELNDEMPF
jgi:hypothetical protein